MSDEERKQVIEEALHGAKVVPGEAPKPSAPVAPSAACCEHCMNKVLKGIPLIQQQPLMAPQTYPNPYIPYVTSTPGYTTYNAPTISQMYGYTGTVPNAPLSLSNFHKF